jgi:hypothetical protein
MALGRIGHPEEIARAALFLAAAFVTGTALVGKGVDGAVSGAHPRRAARPRGSIAAAWLAPPQALAGAARDTSRATYPDES